MENERLVLFFSDVEGTLNKLDYDSAQKLKALLEKKRLHYKADKVVVSLVSNCMNCFLEEYIETLAKPLEDNETIVLGRCFSHDDIIENGETIYAYGGDSKPEKISRYTNDITFEQGAIVAYAMYADDEMTNDIMQTVNDSLKWDVESKVDFFIPGAKKDKNYFIEERENNNPFIIGGHKTKKDNIFTSSKPNVNGLIECMKKSSFKDSDPYEVPTENIIK